MALSPQQIQVVKSLDSRNFEATLWSLTNPDWAALLEGQNSPISILPESSPYAARLHQRGQPTPLYTSEIRLGPVLELVRYLEVSELNLEHISARRLRMMLRMRGRLLDLSARDALLELGLHADDLREDDSFEIPQELAIIAAGRDDVDAIRIPSAVHPGATTIAVFRKSVEATVRFEAEPVVVVVSLTNEEE